MYAMLCAVQVYRMSAVSAISLVLVLISQSRDDTKHLFLTGTPTIFARSIKYWATRSSARFGAVVRHCLDGDGPQFEETVKVLMVGVL